MSLPSSPLGLRPGRLQTLRRVILGTALLFLGAAPGPLSATPSAGTTAHRPSSTQGRRTARRPQSRAKHIVTDQDILDQAQAAYIRGERQHAIDLATTIADKGGELATPAWRFIGLAACSVRANRLASRAYVNLTTAEDQQALVRVCQSNGLVLLNNQFVEH